MTLWFNILVQIAWKVELYFKVQAKQKRIHSPFYFTQTDLSNSLQNVNCYFALQMTWTDESRRYFLGGRGVYNREASCKVAVCLQSLLFVNVNTSYTRSNDDFLAVYEKC
jgi:hypothetical protein